MAKEKKKRLSLKIALGVVVAIILLLLGSLIFVEYSINDLESKIEKEQVEVEESFEVRSAEIKEFVELLNSKMDGIPEILPKLKNAIANLETAEKEFQKANGIKAMSDANENVDLAINNVVDTINNEYDFLAIAIGETDIAEEIDTARHRIVISITNYNKVVDEYNTAIQGFPGEFIANIFGHESKDSFLNYESEDIADLI